MVKLNFNYLIFGFDSWIEMNTDVNVDKIVLTFTEGYNYLLFI